MDERQYEIIEVPMTDQELIEAGDALARCTQALRDIEAEKKITISEISTRSIALKKRITELDQRIASRKIEQKVEVLILLSTPRVGMKRVIRVDTQETIREVPMTHAEMQEDFTFPEPPEPERRDKPDEQSEVSGG